MKAINKICRYAAIVFGLASLVLFFVDFATIANGELSHTFIGAQLAFGSKTEINNEVFDMAKSADILLCFWLTVISAALSIFSFKSKGLRIAASGFGLVSAIYMLVIALSSAWRFIDTRPILGVNFVEYTPFVLVLAISLVLFTISALAYLLIDDYLEVLASKGEKLTIIKRIIHFFRDYKSEVKKIVWPNFKDVIKNTAIVLIICFLVGILIWGVDFGLGKLLELILGV